MEKGRLNREIWGVVMCLDRPLDHYKSLDLPSR